MIETNLANDEAYLAMFAFLERFYEQTRSDDVGGLLGSLSLLPDGRPTDAAITEEWTSAKQAARNNSVQIRLTLKSKDPSN